LRQEGITAGVSIGTEQIAPIETRRVLAIKKASILQRADWPNILLLNEEKAEFRPIVRSLHDDGKQDLSLNLFFKHQHHTFANDFYDR